ncbi:MAG: hypothetical protein ACE5I2_15605, partial [Anaerolineae bacterium]
RGLGTPTFQPAPLTPDQGELVQAGFSIPNAAAMSFSPRLTVTLIDSTTVPAREIRTLIAPTTLQLAPREGISRSFNIDTSALTPNRTYGVRVLLIDPDTQTVLLDQTARNLFFLNPGAVPEFGIALASPPSPLPVQEVEPPRTVTLAINFTVPQGAPPTEVDIIRVVIDQTGSPAQFQGRQIFLEDTGSFTARPGFNQRQFTWNVLAEFPPGDYGARILVSVEDPARPGFSVQLINEPVFPLVRVVAGV